MSKKHDNSLKIKSIHPFPARMAPSIAMDYLPKKGRIKVLDPMAGSGTTLIYAQYRGHDAIGFDRDPLAVLMSTVWSYSLNDKLVHKISNKVLLDAKKVYKKLNSRNSYPAYADDETKKFIRYWFDEKNRKQLTAITKSIAELKDRRVKNLLYCAVSRLIITKDKGVSLAMDVSHSRPHKVYNRAPIKLFDKFLHSVNSILIASKDKNLHSSNVKVKIGDARKLPIEDNSIDLIITSPPYLNAIDYLRGHKLSLVWLGFNISDVRNIRSQNIGTEAGLNFIDQAIAEILKRITKKNILSSRTHKMLARYIKDMDSVISESKRVLTKKGKIVFVVGDSTIKNVFIKNSSVISILAKKHRLRLSEKRTRLLPENRRYLPAPTSKRAGLNLQRRMREEVILAFDKL